jgi:hypothetical protein
MLLFVRSNQELKGAEKILELSVVMRLLETQKSYMRLDYEAEEERHRGLALNIISHYEPLCKRPQRPFKDSASRRQLGKASETP